MATTLTIPARFNGPPGSANGGYAAGLVAGLLPGAGAVEVALRAPPPLDRPLDVVPDGDAVTLRDAETLVASARPGAIDEGAAVPAVSLAEARAGAAAFEFLDGAHPFPTCFGCGPARAAGDGLRVFAGAVPGREGVRAAPWTPAPAVCAGDGTAPDPVAWAALDCASGFAAGRGMHAAAVLAAMTARVDRSPRAGEELIVVAWPVREEGRKRWGASALVAADGELLARADALWIELRPAG